MKKSLPFLLIAALSLAACASAETPSRVGGQSSAPDAQAGGNAGGVGGGNNSTHSNGGAGSGNGAQ